MRAICRIALATGLLAASLGLAACTASASNTPTTTTTTTTTTTAAPTTTTAATTTSGAASSTLASSPSSTTGTTSATCSPVGELAKWPLDNVAAQTIAVPVEETDVGAIAKAVEFGVGGVLLFGSEAPSNLGSQLATLRAETLHHRGLLVMTDEEGGGIQRMANLVGSMPWPRTMAKTMTTAQVFDLTRSVARKMVANGVNVDLAPVVDVDGRDVYPGASDPDGYRSFSGNTQVVSKYGLAYLQGLMAGGVLPVVKHFPGLGGASGNTDDGPATTVAWKTEETRGIPPFETAISHGVPAVMTSNAVVPGLTKLPASISVTATTVVLRDQLKFHGLIITDSLSAGALSDIGYSVTRASVAAIEAGADLVLYSLGSSDSADIAQAMTTRNALAAAVTSHAMSRTQLDEAAAEVLAAKHVDLCG
jgi:beta-N-acetylhexosaminidase